MKIKWVNHASFITEYGSIKMICDPWIDGRVFNEGWEHISETKFTYEDFRDITHIWFSHEHPDHFFPPNLKQIPEQYRKNIVVLYQKTIDKKVSDFCKHLGFKELLELEPWEWYHLSNDFRVMNAKVKNDTDSWLLAKTPEKTYFNTNDCILDDKNEILRIKEIAGNIDVLFTQFSYAAWAGNKEDTELRGKFAMEKLHEIKTQISSFSPTFTVPFASYVWFCLADNFYMNDMMNKIDEIEKYILEIGSLPVILYPGQEWNVGEDFDNDIAISAYLEDIKSKIENPVFSNKASVTFLDLKTTAEAFAVRSLELNNKAKLLSYPLCTFYITDMDKTLSFSFKNGLQQIDIAYDDCDIALASYSLKYCLDFAWGWDTLNVNGAYQKPKNGDFQNFIEYQWVATLNNQGKRIGNIFERAINKVGYLLKN
ncbi:MAG: hypothetical protein HKN92_12450 [Chitinophagales bacterium]|nr:hypothetical protein [Chitinophagales bacterium]